MASGGNARRLPRLVRYDKSQRGGHVDPRRADEVEGKEARSAVIEAKLHQPHLRSETIERPQLIHDLQTSSARLVLVSAPPGFGKTTLVRQWQGIDPRPFAWVSLGTGDDDPVVFWTYIIEALGAFYPEIRAQAEFMLRRPRPDLLGRVVPHILNELESLEFDAVLVLDDYHWIKNGACHDSIALFLERQPSRLQLVLCARVDPPIQLGRLRASGGLLELHSSDLSFTEEETDQFLNGILKLELPAEAVTVLWHRTEGWPAGLYLSYLSLRDVAERDAFVERFSGSNRHIADYLTEVVLGTLDHGTRSFLLETSILERMCGPLCDAVTGRADSGQVLTQLEQANLFLVPLDDRREWYRFHHLFAELLRNRLKRQASDKVQDLHRRASHWFAAAQMPDEAIRHAIPADLPEAATTLIAEHYIGMIEWGRIETILGWLEALPSGTVASDARLSLVKAWVMSFLNRGEEAKRALRDALEAGHEGSLPDGASSLEASASLVRAGFPWDDVGEMLTAARRAFELEGNRESVWRVTVHAQLGWALFLSGRSKEARPLLERAAEMASLSQQWMNAYGAASLLARIALTEDDLSGAERWARTAVDVVTAHGMSDNPQTHYAYTTLGAVFARQGELKEADRLISRGLEQQRGLGQPLLLAEGLLGLAPVRLALGDPGSAGVLLAEATELIEGCRDPGIFREGLANVARMLARSQMRSRGELSDREFEVLRLLAKGLQNREIAKALFISYNTVHSHVRAIHRKLGTSSRKQAIERAHDRGLS